MAKIGNEFSGTFYFLVDEVRYAVVEEYTDDDAWPGGYATINMELSAGQLVRIENVGSTILYGTETDGFYFSWFTGHLLYAL